HPFCHTQITAQGDAPAFPQAFPTILTGFHFASLRHPFISVAFSPPAAHNLACLAACHGCGFVMVFVPDAQSLEYKQKHTPNPCVSLVAVYRRCTAFVATTVAGARSQFRSFLSPLAFGGTPPGYSVDKCATRLCFFLAAGAITFLPTHRKTFPQFSIRFRTVRITFAKND
ncbi:MAG: hypothetical protein V9F01_14245, partial [Chitinophagaceae bacterium]